MGTRGPCGVLFAAALVASAAHADDRPCAPWPQWQAFKRLYLTDDGRVVDAGTRESLTVSEGQAYALTFALIADDRASFEKILAWTRDNLSAGDLGRTLPAWKWGRGEEGKWTILDRNSAADADLWIAYTLEQAGELWHERAYTQLAQAMASHILRDEVALVPGLGATLLPGPRGFVTQEAWRLSASYAPIQVLRALGRVGDASLWTAVLDSSLRVIMGSAPRGYASDWIVYRESQGFSVDTVSHGAGSYNAIRVYLWAGMLADDDPEANRLARQLQPMAAAAAHGMPPESIDTTTLERHAEAPLGFLAALLPLLVHFRYTDVVESYHERIEAGALKDNQHYYSDALTLFGLGWLEGRYRFDRHGDLRVRWSGSCRAD
ncbi:MAG: cellulose synthase complex periplasmic endoglucanase BcsZ [Steroidobacteraceae bacterium]